MSITYDNEKNHQHYIKLHGMGHTKIQGIIVYMCAAWHSTCTSYKYKSQMDGGGCGRADRAHAHLMCQQLQGVYIYRVVIFVHRFLRFTQMDQKGLLLFIILVLKF